LIRGSCEQFKFKTPYSFDQIDKIRITFKQTDTKGNIVEIVKTEADCMAVGDKTKAVYTKLTQEETLRFSTDSKAYVQWRALTTDGIPFSSKIKQITVYPTLDETILA